MNKILFSILLGFLSLSASAVDYCSTNSNGVGRTACADAPAGSTGNLQINNGGAWGPYGGSSAAACSNQFLRNQTLDASGAATNTCATIGIADTTGIQASQPSSINIETQLVDSGTNPSIASGFGSSPTCTRCNNTAAMEINVGTGGSASSGVVTMPSALTRWACDVNPSGAPQAGAVMYAATTSTTSITITNYTVATGIALAWPSGAIITVSCRAY